MTGESPETATGLMLENSTAEHECGRVPTCREISARWKIIQLLPGMGRDQTLVAAQAVAVPGSAPARIPMLTAARPLAARCSHRREGQFPVRQDLGIASPAPVPVTRPGAGSNGALAQLVARSPGRQEVGGSNPPGSTRVKARVRVLPGG